MKILPSNITSLTQLMDTIKSLEKDKEKESRNIVETMLNKKDEDEEEDLETTARLLRANALTSARAVKTMKRNIKLEKIAMKIAKGKRIGIDEENYISTYNKGLLEKAKSMNTERKSLEEKIRLAKTKEEADSLLLMYKEKGILLSLSNSNLEEPNVGKVVMSATDKLDESTSKERKEKEKKLGKIDTLV